MPTVSTARRRLLLLLGTAGVTALAGCSSGTLSEDGTTPGESGTTATTTGTTGTATPRPPRTLTATPGDVSVGTNSVLAGASVAHSLSVPIRDDFGGETLGSLTVRYDGEFDLGGVDAGSVDVYVGGDLEAARSVSVADVRVAGGGTTLEFDFDPAVPVSAGDTVIVEFDGVRLPERLGEYLVAVTLDGGRSDSGALTVYGERRPRRSTFDGETVEGWRIAGDAQGGSALPNHEPSGGNPGRCLSAVDDVQGGVWYWVAPATFRVSDAGFYGGTFTFDAYQSTRSSQFDAVDLRLSGGGVDLVYDFGDTWSHPGTDWTAYAVPLDTSADWRVDDLDGAAATRDDVETVLGDVTRLHIRGEYVTGADTGYLDNPTLWPPGGDPPARRAPTTETATGD